MFNRMALAIAAAAPLALGSMTPAAAQSYYGNPGYYYPPGYGYQQPYYVRPAPRFVPQSQYYYQQQPRYVEQYGYDEEYERPKKQRYVPLDPGCTYQKRKVWTDGPYGREKSYQTMVVCRESR